jgi:mannitol/fructose-specific phosphotransferase system IIA component (Ntr-type)
LQGENLFMRRQRITCSAACRPDLVVRILEVQDRDQLFAELWTRDRVEPKMNARGSAGTIEREKSFPTALGHGVAVPHAYGAG